MICFHPKKMCVGNTRRRSFGLDIAGGRRLYLAEIRALHYVRSLMRRDKREVQLGS